MDVKRVSDAQIRSYLKLIDRNNLHSKAQMMIR